MGGRQWGRGAQFCMYIQSTGYAYFQERWFGQKQLWNAGGVGSGVGWGVIRCTNANNHFGLRGSVLGLLPYQLSRQLVG